MVQAGLDQVAYWNGEVGERWARNHARLDAMFAPLTQALLGQAPLHAGAAVLDIGCGAGETALASARRVGPQGRVSAIDVSAPLLAVARSRAEPDATCAPITWLEADAEHHDFGDGAFDVALSRFGVMFFADSTAAFARLRRTLRPDGHLVFLCWRSIEANPWVAVPREAVLPLVPPPEPPAPDAPGPFRFAEPAAIHALLDAAGFTRLAIDPVDARIVLGRAPAPEVGDAAERAAWEAAIVAAELGPVSRLVRDCPPELRRTVLDAVAHAFAAHARDGCVALDAGCWLVRARA